MAENNNKFEGFPDRMMDYQKDLEDKAEVEGARKTLIEAKEEILDNLLSKVDPKQGQRLQDDFEELKKTEKEVFDKKGVETTQADILRELPAENVWHEIMDNVKKYTEQKGDTGEMDHEENWEVIKNSINLPEDPEKLDD